VELVDFEVERDERTVTISARCKSGALTMTLPIEAASTVSAALEKATEEETVEKTLRCSFRAEFEVTT
jgi:hypothetical protein